MGSPQTLIAADLNRDGNLDIVSAGDDATTYLGDAGNDNLSVLLGQGDGTFAESVNYAIAEVPGELIATDLEGDGQLDLVVTSLDNAVISVLKGNGDGTFVNSIEQGEDLALSPTPTSVVAGDSTKTAT